MIQPLLQQTTNIWKIPPQTDVTCSGVLLQLCSRPSILLISSTIRCSCGRSLLLLFQKATKERTEENCSTAASQSGWLHLRSIERARYATKHVRDTDSDYVMKKPSRCWLGAVPRYWKVVASCFQNVSFDENTSSPLAPRARIFQPILLLFFFFCILALELVYKTVSQTPPKRNQAGFLDTPQFQVFFFWLLFFSRQIQKRSKLSPPTEPKSIKAVDSKPAPIEPVHQVKPKTECSQACRGRPGPPGRRGPPGRDSTQTIANHHNQVQKKISLPFFFCVCVIASFHQDASQFGQS